MSLRGAKRRSNLLNPSSTYEIALTSLKPRKIRSDCLTKFAFSIAKILAMELAKYLYLGLFVRSLGAERRGNLLNLSSIDEIASVFSKPRNDA